MTAIAGIVRLDGHHVDPATLRLMQEQLAPYGRDAQDLRLMGNAGLLRTLLRTTPEDSHDRQPLLDPANACALLFDGRLDNREELSAALGLTARQAAGMADSELALLACVRWDTAALPRMLGDFAIAMWQGARARLWLARSPLGVRPLFWHRQDAFFAFATMPKALLAIPGVPRAVCEKRLYEDMLVIPPTGPESLFEQIQRVQPGHVVTLDGGKLDSTAYHSFDTLELLHLPNDQEYVEAFREQLDRAVAARLRASGPIASHLSSGFDSATVTALAARQLAERGANLLAYTAIPRTGFEAPAAIKRHADERVGAAALAQRFANIRHFLVNTERVPPLDLLAPMVARLDRAPAHLTNLAWLTAINEHAVQHGAKVLLTGQNGNMTISYTGEGLLSELLRGGRLLAWLDEVRGARRHGAHWRGLLSGSLRPLLPGPIWAALQALRGRVPRLDTSPANPRFVARMGRSHRPAGVDVRRLSGQQTRIHVLCRQDRGEHYAAANCAGIEWRDPTGDLRLVEFLLSVPERQFGHHGQDRWLLRRAMDGVLPPEITQVRTKGLQSADWYETLTPEVPRLRALIDQARHAGAAEGYLDLAAAREVLACWPDGANARPPKPAAAFKLQRTITAAAFFRYMDQPSLAAAAGIQQNLLKTVGEETPLFTQMNAIV